MPRAAPCAAMAKIAVAGQRLVLMIAVSDPVLGALPAGPDDQAMASEQAQLAAWKVRKTGYWCKHLPQYVESLHQCRRGQVPQAPDKPPPVYGSNLVEHDKAVLFLKTTRNPEGVGMPAGPSWERP